MLAAINLWLPLADREVRHASPCTHVVAFDEDAEVNARKTVTLAATVNVPTCPSQHEIGHLSSLMMNENP